MPRNDAAVPGQVCPGIRIHAIDIVQPPGIGISPIADIDPHQTIVTAALATKSSAETAKILGLKDRGVIKTGAFADVVAFDSTTFADRSTYEQPTLLAVGMKYVLVNGVLTVDNGKYTGVTAGRTRRWRWRTRNVISPS